MRPAGVTVTALSSAASPPDMDDVCRCLQLQLDHAGLHRADLLDLVGTIAPMADVLSSMTKHFISEYPPCREVLLADAAAIFLVDSIDAVLLRGLTTPRVELQASVRHAIHTMGHIDRLLNRIRSLPIDEILTREQ